MLKDRWRLWLFILAVMMILQIGPKSICSAEDASPDLTELSIEELANIEVISGSRTLQKQSLTPAAIYVITAEDIRRSGVTSVPEALRMVPGVEVARISSSKWAVSSRGFNSRYSNKLLVLIDGRCVYLPLFSGVFWENQDLFLEDIERIEFIRGPGASLWGANAVNGIINIITKNTGSTEGTKIVAGGGDYERGFGRARYGAKIGKESYVRVYAGYLNRDELKNADNKGIDDAWEKYQGGFRTDITINDSNTLTVQGDIFKGILNEDTVSQTLVAPYSETKKLENDNTGYNLLSRLTHRMAGGSEMTLQMYYDTMDKEEGGITLGDDVVDIDFQHRIASLGRHEIVWGLGYRLYKDHISYPPLGTEFKTPNREDSLYSSFVQDTIAVTDDIRFILGSRFEHNEYTGTEIQPNARIVWDATDMQMLWAAVSRAVRTPSRGDNDIRYTQQVIPPNTPYNQSPLPVAVTIWGLENFKSEKLMAYEIGHRLKAVDTFSLDSTAFYYRYEDLGTYQQGDPITVLNSNPPYIISPLYVGNQMKARTWGVEFSANWQALDRVRLIGAYTYFKAHMNFQSDPQTTYSVDSDDDAPKHQFSLRSSVDLPAGFECDVWVRYVDAVLGNTVPSYTEMDVRLGWKATKNIELSICGQNLLHKSHPEYIEPYVMSYPAEVQRSVYGKASFHF